MANVGLTIQNGNIEYAPLIEEGINWETARKGMPGKLTFTVLKEGLIDFQEGNLVRLRVNGADIFQGFVFAKKRDKSNTIQVTAYDQLRYLKNKDTYQYTDTASGLIKRLAADFRLQVGTIEDTGYTIVNRIEENKTLFDIIQNALDLTLQNKKKIYVLYDDFGKLTLKNMESMKLDLLIDQETGENFSYQSSIDGETYNRIKLSYDNGQTGRRDIYIAEHGENINRWGMLQYFENIRETTNAKAKANALLELYNRKTRTLSIANALGDARVRGGTGVGIILNLGDQLVQNYMLVEKVKHVFYENEHRMDLTLRGGDFIA
ncbi:XkdQ/YqbQ family protein [Desulforamulus ruminis]|uniref:Putative phage cell wall hydrolase n=1 Tax=Desulforamulus ruminis (strain ATCC 23193 / DSM 2154 / NCIMB 8452 / DL) TaxID=696281 RepID=F6DPL7_DESRL|nr:hypothetical protein [Desulforamulus ruminis]AEG59594.1 putative phage cell wall hydrolase [Desulforamulus ruminis DSM 2154]